MHRNGPGGVLLFECLSVQQSGAIFHKDWTPCSSLVDSSLSRFAKRNDKEDGRGLR